jgi:predicted amidohydrolase
MRVAVCQIPVSIDPAVNLERAAAALADAAARDADLAVFPEATQARFGSDLRAAAEPLSGPFATQLGDSAAKLGLAVVAGMFEPAADGRVHNTTVAFDAAGQLVTSYRKIHVFDSFGQRESDLVAPGGEVVVADLAGLRVGFLTCYDVRFPEHARALVAAGAQLLVLPSAWAAGPLKEEHWVTLVRARAIENTVWIAAAGQPARRPASAGAWWWTRWAWSGSTSAHGPASAWPRSTPPTPPRFAPRSRACSTAAPTSSAPDWRGRCDSCG